MGLNTGFWRAYGEGMAADETVLDVLVVGAGPTGLTLARELAAFGARFRIVDRQLDRVHESRALAIQPRTLEVLTRDGTADRLLDQGNSAVELHLHLRRHVIRIPMFDTGLDDTRFPFLLFVSQAETERIISEHLSSHGVTIERGTELVDLQHGHDAATAVLRGHNGARETVQARHVVGCDGAHSAVRQLAGIPFKGGAYPQTFLLADLEVDGLRPGAAHAYMGGDGILFFFPLGSPAPWRMLVMRPPDEVSAMPTPTLTELQALADRYCEEPLRLREPIWMTDFRLHNRGAAQYRAGRVFLAGDAAHIHSPAGAQGMNTGIQDAVNLGWKLAWVSIGAAIPALLDTYETERAPVGRTVLRFTDRAFSIGTTTSPVLRAVRTRIVPVFAPLAARFRAGRAAVFRTVSQLGIHYRASPLSIDGRPTLRRRPRSGDRLPDAPVLIGSSPTTLQAELAAPSFHLLLCGPAADWPTDAAGPTRGRPEVMVHRLDRRPGPGVLQDPTGTAFRRLGCSSDRPSLVLVRPDGHIAYRAPNTDVAAAHEYLNRWLVRRSP